MSKLCWWCSHEIPGEVYKLPFKLDKGRFHLMGQFCSWPCVKSYNIFSDKPTLGRTSDLITLYRQKTLGKITVLNAAPPRFSLKAFGGTLTIEEFRSGKKNVSVMIPNEPWILVPESIDIPIQIDTKPDNDLVLKRNKPLKRDTCGIQKLLLTKSSA